MNPKVTIMLAKQVQECSKNPPAGTPPFIKLGIKVILNESDITDVQAEIEGPVGTPYEGGIFRCKLAVENDFPNNPPKGTYCLIQATSSVRSSIPTYPRKEKYA
jgi:ubiquitin-conjugating enzyme E2 S